MRARVRVCVRVCRVYPHAVSGRVFADFSSLWGGLDELEVTEREEER